MCLMLKGEWTSHWWLMVALGLCAMRCLCVSLNSWGFEIDQGAIGARFLSCSQTYLGLDREGDFFTFDVEIDSGYASCGEDNDGAFMCADDYGDGCDMWDCVECVAEHADILHV